MAPLTIREAADRLRSMDHILLLTHRRPDGDTIGSAAALCLGLRQQGKTAYTAENAELTPRYASLLSGLTPPADFVPAAVVSIDIAAPDLVPDAMQPLLARLDLVIDHHPGNRLACPYRHIDGSAGACGEIIFDLLSLLGVSLTPGIAQALYVAVSTDTGCFQYSNTTGHSHRVAAACLEAGADAGTLNHVLFGVKSRPRLAAEALLTDTMRYEAGGQIALAVLRLADIQRLGATADDLDNIASLTRSIEGVDIGILVKETPYGCKVSVRTGGSDAAAIAGAVGGGGHLRAAGADYHGTLEDAVSLLLEKAREELPRA